MNVRNRIHQVVQIKKVMHLPKPYIKRNDPFNCKILSPLA